MFYVLPDHPVAGRGPGRPEQAAHAPPPTDRRRLGEQGHRPLTFDLAEEVGGEELAATESQTVVFQLRTRARALYRMFDRVRTEVGGASGAAGGC